MCPFTNVIKVNRTASRGQLYTVREKAITCCCLDPVGEGLRERERERERETDRQTDRQTDKVYS